MTEATQRNTPISGGIQIYSPAPADLDLAHEHILTDLKALGLDHYVRSERWSDGNVYVVGFQLHDEASRALTPSADTTQLCEILDLDARIRPQDLDREILVAMLAGPVAFSYPSYDEMVSAVRIRKNIVQGASRTALAFDTEEAERPAEYWTYSEARGFTIKPGKSLITALEKATQPDRSGKLYSFSCYRATEYVMLLGIAQELAVCNPELFERLQWQWETRALMSTPYHDIFLREYGSLSNPLPSRYYVPGDRLWFRNPDEYSSNVEGYEGSWVFYLGNGLFTNFWKRDQPFTLTTKCVELFHWRNATFFNGDGKLQVDDDVVDARVLESLQNPAEIEQILSVMLRLREAAGIYTSGGCIDATRECARRVRPGTAELVFPGADLSAYPDIL